MCAGFELFGTAVIDEFLLSAVFVMFGVSFGGNGCATLPTTHETRKSKVMRFEFRDTFLFQFLLYCIKEFSRNELIMFAFEVFAVKVHDTDIELVGEHFVDLANAYRFT